MIRQFISRGVALALLISLNLGFGTSEANALELTRHGREALAQIAECINRDDKDTLNVLYLIDDSRSLNYNDLNDVRADALVSSLSQFASASELRPFFKINRQFSTFSNTFSVRKNWSPVNTESFNNDRKWILENIPNLENGTATDWENALINAQKQFDKVSTVSSCEILVWFTDGGLSVPRGQGRDVRTALSNICGIDPITLKNSGSSIIDELRQDDVWIQGILLKNEEAQRTELTEEERLIERSLMSYFSVVVEQSGVIDPYIFEPSQTTFSCGENSGAFGLVQTVTDPVDIIWPTQQFNCLSTGGRVLNIKNGKFEIDPGLTRFSVTALSRSFQLVGPNGETVANSQGVVKGNVSASFLNSSESVIQISGDVSKSSNKSTSPGIWKIQSSENDKAVVCGFLDFEIQVSVSTCYLGEECDFEGTFTQRGLEANFANFRKTELRAGELTGQRSALPKIELNGSSFQGELRSNSTSSTTYLGVLLNLTTESGIEFEVSTKRPIQIIPPGIYPSISPDPIRVSDFSTNLVGKNGKATTSLLVEGPSRTSGKVCLGPLQVRSDANPKRIPGFETFLDGSSVGSEKCFELEAGGSRNLELAISNPVAANGTSKGFIKATYFAQDKPEINSKVDVQFKSEIVYDPGARFTIFALLMLLGIGIPLAGLYLLNLANSKILLDNLYMASIPVFNTASGGVVTLKRADDAGSLSLITQEDFIPFSAGIKKEKKVQIAQESIQGIAPKSPFGAIRSLIRTNDNSIIVSSSIESSRGLAANEAPGSLNLSGLMYLVQSKEGNESVKAQNQGVESSSPVESRLVALLSFDGDPFQQVDKLDSDIKFNAGWLNKLLEVNFTTSAKSKKSSAKKNSKQDKSIDSQGSINSNDLSKGNQDGWGDSASTQSASSGEVSDDWGNSSSQSKDDDW